MKQKKLQSKSNKLHYGLLNDHCLVTRSIRLEDLSAGRAVSHRNRRIGEFLKELDLTEGRSTGIPKILRVMQTNGSPTPVFETDDDRSYFIIRLPVYIEAQLENTPEVTDQVTDQVKRLLGLLELSALSSKELMMKLKLSHRPTFAENYLQPALNKSLIELTQPDSPRSPTQKYRLTETGLLLLKTFLS